MSALTRFVTNTFTDISHKRQSKRLVHDESVHNDSNGSSLDMNPNFNFFDPSDHLRGEGWEGPSVAEQPTTQSTQAQPKAQPTAQPSSKNETKQTSAKDETTTMTEVSSGKLVMPLKNMVRKLTPSFNNNSKEIKDKNVDNEATKTGTDRTDDEAKKKEKKGVWNLKEQIEKRKGGDRQMLIDLDGDSF
ncbi:unnamed protein product, partial [Mesorhabditis belari]|uniref:Uncharacterized protein n=1 Tax=Mesorhabditis belari TaxID=2138241 RepID=A0AAF3EHX8_9BILA